MTKDKRDKPTKKFKPETVSGEGSQKNSEKSQENEIYEVPEEKSKKNNVEYKKQEMVRGNKDTIKNTSEKEVYLKDQIAIDEQFDEDDEIDEALVRTIRKQKVDLKREDFRPYVPKGEDSKEISDKIAMGNTLMLDDESGPNNMTEDSSSKTVGLGSGSDQGEFGGLKGPLSGSVFESKYKVGELIGEGGMGSVYKATHIMMRHVVALKILLPVFGQQLDMIERFRREAESTARLKNPHIIQVLDFGRSEDGIFYLVMEFINGVPLSNHLIDGPLNWQRACRIMSQITDALFVAHENGVVHRDLKPDNIMVTIDDGGKETIKILDFGIAKLSQPQGDGMNITRMGMIFGTPSYISPEQGQGKMVTHSADIYAAGVILFKMITGKLPFTSESTIDLINQHINEAPPRPNSIINNIPEELDALILKCLAKSPKHRPKTAYEMRAVLGNLMEVDTFNTTLHISMGSRANDFFFTSIGKKLLLLLVVLILGGVGAYLLRPFLFKSTSEKPAKISYPSDFNNKIVNPKVKINKEEDMEIFTLIKKGKFDEALKLAEMRVSKNPSDVKASKVLKKVRFSIVTNGINNAHMELAGLNKSHELELFISKIRKWVGWFPRDGELHYVIALGYSRIGNDKRSLSSMSKALLMKPDMKKRKVTKNFIVRYLKNKRQWIRRLCIKMVKETYSNDSGKALEFLWESVNNIKNDADDRYVLYQFLKERAASKGVDELRLWKYQIMWSTSCKVKKEASIWFEKFGKKKNIGFMKKELRKRKFKLSSGKKRSTKCYIKELRKAYKVARKRK
jgi:serine/threonine protein kinase